MSLNWREIDLILNELHLEGARIQKVQQPDFHTLLLELYHPEPGRYTLLIDLSQQGCRLHRLHHRKQATIRQKHQRYVQLLRSKITGGKITGAEQIHQDRIVQFIIEHRGTVYYLYARLWGSAANMLLCSRDHTILDAFYRRPGKHEQSGDSYNPRKEAQPHHKQEFTPRERSDGESFNEQISREYYEKELREHIRRLSTQAESYLGGKESKLLSRLSGMQRQSSIEGGERTRELADLLAANIHRIEPKSTSVTVEDFYHGNRPVEIPLDPSVPAGKQVEALYQQFQKEQRTREHREQELGNLERQLDDLAAQRTFLLEEWENLEAQREALSTFIASESGVSTVTRAGERIPGLQFRSGPFVILVGRTARENDELLRNYTRGNDYWLHARDYPGGYVFIKFLKGKTVPLDTLLDAGNLALYFSKAKKSGKADLYVAQVKHLRRAKHGKLGTVIPTQEKNLFVELDHTRLKRLLGGTP